MTLADLVDRIDWTDADTSRQQRLEGKPEPRPTDPVKHRATLLDGALYLMRCVKCAWKGIRDTSGELYSKCPMCNSEVAEDWEGRMWSRAVLGDVWKQAEEILKSEGLAK